MTFALRTAATVLASLAVAAFAASAAFAADAPRVDGGWVRGTVAGQSATGAFMTITAPTAMELVGVQTPVAAVAEVHEMAMEGNVMRMRAVPKLSLPAGKAVELKPGGYHLMLQDLKQPLASGNTVPVTLVLRDAKGQTQRVELKLPVAMQPPGAAAASRQSAAASQPPVGAHMPSDHKH